MVNANFKRIKAIEDTNKKRLLLLNPDLNDGSGIYFFTRIDENGFKYAYIGQAKHILTRLAQHLSGHTQHIDRSLIKHKLYSVENQHGWKVGFLNYPESKLDDMEQKWIREYAECGYQLRNKTSGSQGTGKSQIDEYRPSKGYRDGIQQGKITLSREIKHIVDLHLMISLRKDTKIAQKQLAKFWELINEENYK